MTVVGLELCLHLLMIKYNESDLDTRSESSQTMIQSISSYSLPPQLEWREILLVRPHGINVRIYYVINFINKSYFLPVDESC